jgi:hypothetical protein
MSNAGVAVGEVEGVMVAAGRYYNQPAIRLLTDLYEVVWCVLSSLDEIGDKRLRSLWDGKRIGVQGELTYARGGRLTKIENARVREIEAAHRVDLDSVLDPGFTAGMDPNEYLRKMHEGELGPKWIQ